MPPAAALVDAAAVRGAECNWRITVGRIDLARFTQGKCSVRGSGVGADREWHSAATHPGGALRKRVTLRRMAVRATVARADDCSNPASK